MNDTTCRCGRPTRDKAYLCDDCGHTLSVALGDVPWLDEELETSITRAKGIDYRTLGGTRGGEAPSTVHWGASEARTQLRDLLASWVMFAHETNVPNSSPHPGLPDVDLVAMSRWLMWRVDGFALLDIGPEIVDEITDAVQKCHRVIDRPADQWFAGPCDECEVDMYVKAGSRQAKCRMCGELYDVSERRAWLLEQARMHNATATEIARAVVVWGEFSVGESRLVDRIRKWGERNRIMVTGHTSVRGTERAMYRVGDVLRLLEEDATNRQAKASGAVA